MSANLVVIAGTRQHSNHAEIARALAIDIVSGALPTSAKLPGDAQLLQRFGISRPVLRESIKTLVAKGLLTTKARVGTVVREREAWNMFDPDVLAWHLEAGIDGRFLRDLAEIRLAAEPKAAALAAKRRTEADLMAMHAALARMEREPSDAVGFAEGDLDLHLAVAKASGNPFMRSLGAVVDAALRASFRLSAPTEPQDRADVLTTHREIVAAIASRDAEAAATAMTGVIHNGLQRHRAAH